VGGGVGAGYGLSRLLCGAGGCPITSNRWLMAVLGAILGGYLGLAGCSAMGKGNSEAGSDKATLRTTEEFRAQVLQSKAPVVVDFFATWCGPCRMLDPILEKLQHEYAGRILFVAVDVDKAGELASSHGIRSIPTLEFYLGGERVDRMVGLPRDAQTVLRERLERLLAGS
jgi:thioredoxin 1